MSDLVHIVVDCETQSLESDASIVQIGAVCINPKGTVSPRFTRYISALDNAGKGYHVSCETMEWWAKQPANLRQQVFSGTWSTRDALADFSQWTRLFSDSDTNDNVVLWANHIDADLVWIKNAYLKEFGHYPYSYKNHMDYATLSKLFLQVKRPEVTAQAHDALVDAEWQAEHLNNILHELHQNGLIGHAFYSVS